MAKKKHNQHQEKEAHLRESAMEDASDKLESLKSLNSILLKETVERRQQVDSLLQSKGSLEAELTRSNSKKEVLEAELTRLSEGLLRLEVERDVMVVFVVQQAGVIEMERVEFDGKMKEWERDYILKGHEKMKSENEREIELLNEKVKELVVVIEKEKGFSKGVCLERDEMRAELDFQINEAKELGRRLIYVEKKERVVREEVEKLRAEYNLVVKGKEEGEKQIESMKKGQELLEKNLGDVKKAAKEMRTKIEGIVKEKEQLEKDNKVEVMKRNELEKVVAGHNEMVDGLRKEEERLLINVAGLEKKCMEGEEKESEMNRQIDELVKEKDGKERKLLKVFEEKSVVEKELNEALKRLDELKLKMDEIVNEKSEIAEAKVRKESEIVELEKQVADRRKTVLGLEDCCRVQKENIISLESEVRSYKDLIERVSIERDEALKGFEAEKQNGVSLLEKIKVMEKNIEENSKFVEKMKTESSKLRDEKEDLESLCNSLKKEIASAKDKLAEARKELHFMKHEVELAGVNSEQILQVLRSTALLVCPKDDVNAPFRDAYLEKEINGEVEAYMAELEAIKNAFKRRETALEDMKRQLEFLENSVAEAHKKKSFWTVISSATTICAAISLAYVVRGH